MSEREGQRIGNYHLHRLLGKGAFAEVYLGEHLYLKNYAAIKILHTSLHEKNEDLFLSEAQIIAQLTHPNIVPVREFAIERSTPYLVMDYAPGGTLRHRYPKGTCLSLEKTISYVKQIAAALQYAHNRGIIHRDVKPENVLQGSEHVMVGDFGISVHLSVPNTISPQAGTRPYMAPEQFRGKTVFASDQYALAIVAYEWLCGVRPFDGSPLSLEYQHGNVPPPRLREQDPSLPEAVETVVLKALSKKPEDRYVSIINFARALERASQDSVYEIHADSPTDSADTPHAVLSRRVFLSHTSLDNTTHLQTDLTTRNISVLDDSTSESQEEQTRQAIRAAQVVLLVLTPHTRSSAAVQNHLRIASLYRRRIICVWQQGDDLHNLLPVGAEHATIVDARGQRRKEALGEISGYLEQEYRGTANSETRLPDYDLEPRNPYKGLLAFTQKDRADFFGRASVVQELLALLKRVLYAAPTQEPEARFLAVVGPSGSGKSSVVLAGLLPKLLDGALPGSEEWVYLDPIVPGKQPLATLVQLLAKHFPEQDAQTIRKMLSRDGDFGLHQLARTLVSQPESHIVLTIDQCEELFSPAIPEQERQHFIQLLVTAATEPDGPIIVLLTLRADFYDRPLAYPTLGRLIQQQQCIVLPMSAEDLREVIERPALLPDVRLIFEEDLVGDLLFDMRGQMGALPLLEFALEQLFHHRRERRLTRRAYQEIGGVRGALSKHAESTYEALPSQAHRRLARTLFTRLVQPGEQGQEPLRRRAALSEFNLAEASEKQQMQETLEAFITARLLTTNQSGETTTIEVSHEAVIREWKRLTEWLHEEEEDIRLQQSLSGDVAEWNQRKRPNARLYRGVQLKEAQAWATRNRPNEHEAAFLRASATRRIQLFVSLIVIIFLLVSLTGVAGWYIFLQPQPTLVTTLQDKGVGSLRWCVDNAPTGSTIRFASGMNGTIELTGGGLTFQGGKQLTLVGPGAKQLSISGGDLNASIHVAKGATLKVSGLSFKDSQTISIAFIFNEGTLTMTDSIISNNKNSTGSNTFGGGIQNQGTLTLTNSTVSNNTAISGLANSQGGGIYNAGTLIMTKSTISGNKAMSTSDLSFGGGILNLGTVTMTDSHISDNTADSPNSQAFGGGITNQGTLTLTNSTISNNTASSTSGASLGGGIYNKGKLTVTKGTFSGNIAVSRDSKSFGGAIMSKEISTVTITDSHISDNIAKSTSDQGQGGGIANEGKLTITKSTFSGNMATSHNGTGFGGGLNNNTTGTVTISDSTLSNNTTSGGSSHNGQGGAISNSGKLTMTSSTLSGNKVTSTNGVSIGGAINSTGTLTIANSTLSNNTTSSTGGQSVGGGIVNYKGTLTMTYNTLFGNTATSTNNTSFGGGIDNYGGNLTLSINIIVANKAQQGSDIEEGPDIVGSLTSNGYNLIQDKAGVNGLSTTDRQVTLTDLKLDPTLRNNGGPTQTLALLPGSIAIDTVPIEACHITLTDASGNPMTITTDQRGNPRPNGSKNTCDIGAYEL